MNTIGNNMTTAPTPSSRRYRLDRFVVPPAAREEFLARVRQTHALLRKQAGFIRDILLEKPATGEKFILVTLVEWRDADSIALARETVAAMHRETGFNSRDFMARHGIEAEIGNFTDIAP